MKILTDSIPHSHHQEVLGSKQNAPLHISVPTTSDTYATLTSVVADSYDKQELNNIFDSLLQKWPETSAFPDPSTEVSRVSLFQKLSYVFFAPGSSLNSFSTLCACQTLPYSDPFPEDQSSPVYSGSYTDSPPERFRSEFQFSLGAPLAAPYKSTELPMVYLNKGQFYPITLQGVDNSACITATKVKVSHLKTELFFWMWLLFQVSSFPSGFLMVSLIHKFFACHLTNPSQISVPPLETAPLWLIPCWHPAHWAGTIRLTVSCPVQFILIVV